MRKRKNSDEESSEMEVDDEERKIEMEVDDDEEEEPEEMEGVNDDDTDDGGDDDDDDDANKNALRGNGRVAVENPFLDSFYSLSSQDHNKRSQAAQVLLHHCLLGPNANSKDAAYAFRRLLNGLCSGRAAARQGNASALASFLKIAFRLGKMEDIKDETLANDSTQETSSSSSSSSLLKYVRDRLISATDPNQTIGKKKGSEERDYHFGRLFGILAIVRSNILLLPHGTDTDADNIESSGYDEIKEIASAMVCDLVELFWLRKWMREPAAHGIVSVLSLFFESNNSNSQLIAQHLIEEVVVPKILIIMQDKKNEESDFQILMQSYCAEQVGIGAYIQSQSKSEDLPFPLDQPIVSIQTLPWIGQALSETSVIVQPRTHFVWDTLWSYLTEKVVNENSLEDKEKDQISLPQYILRKTIPFSDDDVVGVVDAIMKIVVEEKLLGIDKDKGASISKTTHERKSLALCIVRNLSGAPFVSSISGPTQINMDSHAIENIFLTPDIIRSLFIGVICAGNQKQRASHMLKPLALEVLSSLVESTVESGDTSRQLAFVKAFSNCEPRFDSQTKTNTISDLLSFSSETITKEEQSNLWGKYLTHLETRFLQLCNSTEESDSSAEANGYVELLYSAAKNILHTSSEDKFKENAVKRIIGLFMSTAFFDCSKVTKPTKQKKGKKGSKKIPVINSAVESASKVRNSLQEGKIIAYSIRAIVSARFFSLISEFALVASRESKKDDDDSKVEKDTIMLAMLAEICENWKQLESNEAKRFVTEKDDEEDDDDDSSPELIIMHLQSKVSSLKMVGDDNKDEHSKMRCSTGIAALAMTLYLHRLSCGPSNNELDEDPDADEEEDEEEICNAIEGLKAIAHDFLEGSETDSNPLLGLAEICANILSSPLGSGSIGRGAAPKLVREAVKYAWLGGLRLASTMATEEKTLLDSSVVGLLMEAIGAANGSAELTDGDVDMEGESDEEEDESDGESDDDLTFSKASQVLDDPDDMETGDHETRAKDEDESDVEIDPSKLQSMLEDDSDADAGEYVLEHHEGADAALAALIKLKQDTRKAGQQAREKIEVSNQLRCSYLIDLLLGRPDSWNKLFRSSIILEMVVPLLDHRKRVGKLTQKATESGKNSGSGEKKALLHRMNSLIKQKLLKIRLSSMPLAGHVDMDAATNAFQQIMKEARKSKDKEHSSCCSSCLIFLLRIMPSSPGVISLATTEYGDVIREWSTKRNSGASLLDDLISHMPTLAQASLLVSLNRATQDARSPFLKVESFRLLSLVLSNKPNQEGLSETERMAQAKIHESQDDLLIAISKTLKDDEMVKPKRVRSVFKAFEKMLPVISSPASPEALSMLANIKTEISGLGAKQSSLNILSTKLVEQIDIRLEELNVADATPTMQDTTKNVPTSNSNKSKKKKKKKK